MGKYQDEATAFRGLLAESGVRKKSRRDGWEETARDERERGLLPGRGAGERPQPKAESFVGGTEIGFGKRWGRGRKSGASSKGSSRPSAPSGPRHPARHTAMHQKTGPEKSGQRKRPPPKNPQKKNPPTKQNPQKKKKKRKQRPQGDAWGKVSLTTTAS